MDRAQTSRDILQPNHLLVFREEADIIVSIAVQRWRSIAIHRHAIRVLSPSIFPHLERFAYQVMNILPLPLEKHHAVVLSQVMVETNWVLLAHNTATSNAPQCPVCFSGLHLVAHTAPQAAMMALCIHRVSRAEFSCESMRIL
jgi:hypothetical protein